MGTTGGTINYLLRAEESTGDSAPDVLRRGEDDGKGQDVPECMKGVDGDVRNETQRGPEGTIGRRRDLWSTCAGQKVVVRRC